MSVRSSIFVLFHVLALNYEHSRLSATSGTPHRLAAAAGTIATIRYKCPLKTSISIRCAAILRSGSAHELQRRDPDAMAARGSRSPTASRVVAGRALGGDGPPSRGPAGPKRLAAPTSGSQNKTHRRAASGPR